MEKSFSWKKVLVAAFAFLSCGMGSGFASGQIPLQFFGSGGGWFSILSVWIFTVGMIFFATYHTLTVAVVSLKSPVTLSHFMLGNTALKYLTC